MRDLSVAKQLFLNAMVCAIAIFAYEALTSGGNVSADDAKEEKPTKLIIYDEKGNASILLNGETRHIYMYAPGEPQKKAIHIGFIKSGYWGYWTGNPTDKSEVTLAAGEAARSLLITDEEGVKRIVLTDVNKQGSGFILADGNAIRANLSATRKDEVGIEMREPKGKVRTVYLGSQKDPGGVLDLHDYEEKRTALVPEKK